MNYMNRRKGHYAGNCIHSEVNARRVDRRCAGRDYRSGPAYGLLIDKHGNVVLDKDGKPIRKEVI